MSQTLLIISGGAMGSLFGGLLTVASQLAVNNVNVIVRTNWNEHRREIAEKGLVIHPSTSECKSLWLTLQREFILNGGENAINIPINTVDDSFFTKDSNTVDHILLFEKSCNTRLASRLAKMVLKENGSCLTLQNGMGNVEILQRELGENRVIQGSTSHGASIVAPGSVEHGGIGYITLSSSSLIEEKVQWWLSVFKSVHLEAFKAEGNFQNVLWSKLLVNCAINPLSSLFDVPNGSLLSSKECITMMKAIIKEGVTVAKSCGVTLDYDDCVKRTLLVAEHTSANTSSMLSDIRKKQRTEIDFMNGYIERKGNEHHIETPFNSFVTQCIHIKQDLYYTP